MNQADNESIDFLLAQISHLHHARAHQIFESVGLYRGQPPVLREIWDHEGLTQTELAERLKNTPATVTKTLQRMEKSGFVVRRPDPDDQRISRVYLTEAGKAVQKDVEGLFRTIEAETFADFTGEEQEVLRGYFLRIRENLIRATGESPFEKHHA